MNVTIRVPFEKADAAGRFVSGWASVAEIDGRPVVDSQGDVIPLEELAKAAHRFVADARVAKMMHDGEPVGEVVESVIVDDAFAAVHGIGHGKRGWWIKMEVHSEAVRARIRQGEIRAISIGGRGRRNPEQETV